MFLKEITIEGFKSFARKTRLELGKGVTTIVGPNGCGKSNVVDAIRWVLGEQSPKALRGGKMFDVIFAGTEKLPPSEVCQVVLLFAECEGALGTELNEVEVARRLTRQGDSTYFLNRKVCRLKDIQELFMDTGVGRVSYSFMVQGQIDQILSNNPSERRIIFEEAAGISRYKTQRAEALGKLSQVEQNLVRIQDVVREVCKQMETLKRQAIKAIKFQNFKHRLAHLELAHMGYTYLVKAQIRTTLEKNVAILMDDVDSIRTRLEKAELDISEQKRERKSFYEKLQFLQQEFFDVKSKKEHLSNELDLAQMRQKDTQARLEFLLEQGGSMDEQIEALEVAARESQNTKRLEVERFEAFEGALEEKTKAVEAVENELRATEKSFIDLQKEKISLEEAINRQRLSCSRIEVEIESSQSRQAESLQKQSHLAEEKQKAELCLETMEFELSIQEKAARKAEVLFNEAKEILKTCSQTYQKAITQEQEKKQLVEKMHAQLSILEALQAKLEGFSEGSKALLKGKLGGGFSKEDFLLLTEGLVVKEGYCTAIESFLGNAFDAVALSEEINSLNVVDALEKKKFGKTCLHLFVPLKTLSAQNTVPKEFLRAIEVITVCSKDLKTRWDCVLDGCFIVETLESFLTYWLANPSFSFRFVATRKGELLDARGFLFVPSHSSNRSAHHNFIERTSQIRKLKLEVSKETKVLLSFSKEATEAKQALEKAESELETIRSSWNESLQKLSTTKVQAQEAQRRLESINLQVQKNDQQLDSQVQLATSSTEKLQTTQAQLEALLLKFKTLQTSLAETECKVNSIRQLRDQKREILAEFRVELAEKRQKLNSLTQNLSVTESKYHDSLNQKKNNEKEISLLQEGIKKFSNQIECAGTQIEEITTTISELSKGLETHKNHLESIEVAILELEKGLSQERSFLHSKEQSLSKDQVALEKVRSELSFVTEKMLTEYQKEISEVNWQEELSLAEQPFKFSLNVQNLFETESIFTTEEKHLFNNNFLKAEGSVEWGLLESETVQLKAKIKSMGAVNLIAVDEYAELSERYRFLTEQCEDLTASQKQLLEAIEKINETSERLFRETFQKIRQNFQFTFDALFGGGSADLQLEEESKDFLDAGIHIVACPPGAKLKNLSLLSGGQKTMTAVALLFAIYKVKPSPFCVLDELDAPLDDANIGRFTTMLREFTRYSQFLVISHNKRTIAASDALYGVTMQEKGVTELISMKFKNINEKESKRVIPVLEKTAPTKEEISPKQPSSIV